MGSANERRRYIHVVTNPHIGWAYTDNDFWAIIVWTSAGLLPIGLLGTTFSEILIKLQNFSFTRINLTISAAKRRPFSRGRWVNFILIPMHPTPAEWGFSGKGILFVLWNISMTSYLNYLNNFSSIIHENDINLITKQIQYVLKNALNNSQKF